MQNHRQKENQYLVLESEVLYRVVVIGFQGPLEAEEEATEKEDMTTGDKANITPHIIASMGATLKTNKCLMDTIPEVIVPEDVVAREVEGLDHMKSIFATRGMLMTILMEGVAHRNSIIHGATKKEDTILTTQGVNRATLITTDV